VESLEAEKIGKVQSGKLTRNNPLDAGQDVYSSEEVIIYAGESKVVKTNLRIDVPQGCVGLLWSRSGLSVKHNIEVGAGCIDSGYTGEVAVHLYNHGSDAYKVNAGDKIAQLLTIPVNLINYVEVDELDDSARGDNGFNSSGY
jgi:dUTP pyrophosphatase